MKELKLVSILKTFSKTEFKEFEKFIASPFHNKGRNFKLVFSYLKKLYPQFPEDKLDSEKLYRKLYPGKKYDRSKSSLTIRVLFSQLTQIAEEFLLIRELHREENLLIRNNMKYKFNYRNKLSGIYAEKPLTENLNYLHNRIESYIESSFHILTNENLVNLKVMNADYNAVLELREQNLLYSLNSYMDILYYIVASNLALKQRINRGLNGINFYKSFLNSLDEELIKEYVYDDNKGTKNVILFNYYISKFILNNDFEDVLLVDKIIDYYKEIFPALTFELKHSFFVRLSNILVLGSHKDTELYGKKIDMISDYILENNCYTENNGEMMSGMSYMNIFVYKEYFLNAGELRTFIKKYIKYVEPGEREYAEKISEVCYCIKSGDYEKGLRDVSRINTNETLYKIILYRYKLILLYELKMYEELISYIDSFEHYLRNNKLLNDFMREMYATLCKALKLMIKINLDPSEKGFDELERAVNNCKNKVFYRWVKEKSIELKNTA